LYFGNYRFLEKTLIALVLLMSFSFVITAVITGPDPLEVLKGLLIPKFPEKSLLTIIGLIGTTVVPYNLFLHAALVKEKWKNSEALPLARRDTVISIVLGGLVSMAILISAAGIPAQDINNASDLAKSLEPLYGSFAKYFLALGLFAAGITSAITAPLAAAYVAKGCLGWKGNQKSRGFRGVWMFILIVGVFFSAIGISPIEIIKFAQVANGILLPVIVGVLLWIMNKKNVLGVFSNSLYQNIVGFIILGISIFLGLKSILTVFSLL
jgi:Mn2+/Fe2+ NRAMP family transporter